ncbi:AAA family ATPase [Moorena sp. SIO3A2]|uniref:AAA family ATPase n=1 Tax=Moorena sp. SIO3A2 TaxID=2607841 RepID=UPI0013BCCE8E|nr:AAA family ATPase [Moorena sp. SIO3A2]NER90320.1 AAA family ATPase [Moorena sp. SIO3A2]
MQKVDCYMLVGIPASGKSTYAKKLAEETGGVIVCPDDIRKELWGDSAVQGPWKNIKMKCLTRMFFAISQNKTIIYDATNILIEHRQDVMVSIKQKLPMLLFDWKAIYFAAPFQWCVKRNELRERKVPVDVIERMRFSIVPPSVEEGFTEVTVMKAVNVLGGQ